MDQDFEALEALLEGYKQLSNQSVLGRRVTSCDPSREIDELVQEILQIEHRLSEVTSVAVRYQQHNVELRDHIAE